MLMMLAQVEYERNPSMRCREMDQNRKLQKVGHSDLDLTGHNPQKAHLHPLRVVGVKYGENPSTHYRNMVRKQFLQK